MKLKFTRTNFLSALFAKVAFLKYFKCTIFDGSLSQESALHQHKLTIISELNNTNDPDNDSKVETPEKKDESFNESCRRF